MNKAAGQEPGATPANVAPPEQQRPGWRWLEGAAILFLLLTLPLPRHWVWRERPPELLYFEFTSYIVYLSDVAAIFLVLVALLRWWRERRRAAPAWGPLLIALPLVLLPAGAALSAFGAQDRELALYFAGRLTLLLLVYLSLIQLRPSVRLLQVGMAASLLLQALVGLAQFAMQRDLGLQLLLGEIDLVVAPARASFITAGSRLWLRAYGLTPHPNILGGVLVAMLLPLVVAYLEQSGRWCWLWLAGLASGAAALILSFSRSAWLSLATGGTLFLIGLMGKVGWRQRYGPAVWRPLLIGALLLAPFLFLRRDLFLARLRPSAAATESRSLDERAALNQFGRQLIAESPWRGVGAGNFSVAVMPLVGDTPGTYPQPAHNLPLLLTAELGIAGGVLWLWLMVAPLIVAWQRYRAGRLTLWAWGLTAALLALAITDLFDFYSWGWPQGRLLRWTWLAFVSSAVVRET